MMTRKTLVLAALCSVVIGAAALYIAGRWLPFDTSGEGYPW